MSFLYRLPLTAFAASIALAAVTAHGFEIYPLPLPNFQERFPGVRLDGPRDLDESAPTVVDSAWFVAPELRKELTWDFADLPLSEFAAEFSQKVGLPVLINEDQLRQAGIPADEPISGALAEEPAYLLLERELRDPFGLDWFIADGVIHITTKEIADKRLVTKVYHVGRLLDSGCTMPSLIETLESTTSAHWEEVDGVGGTISEAGPALTIRQSERAHREIAGMFEALRHPRQRTIVGDSPRREQIEKQLDQSLLSVSFDEVPLEKAVAHLAVETGIPVHINTVSLVDVGVEPDTPVTLHIENRSARTIFELILADLPLTTINRTGLLQVTATEYADKQPLIAVYDVSDLCRNEAQTDTLMEALLSDTGGPWLDREGIGGSVAMPRVGTLVIRQTEQIQREVADVLAQLRATLDDGETLEAADRAGDDRLETRFYHLPARQAGDLYEILPQQIEPGSWQSFNEDGIGRMSVIAADPQLQPVSRGKETTVIELPRAILMVRQKRGVLRKIERFLKKMAHDTQDRDGTHGASSGIGFSSVPETDP